jgi:general secretion pathway protein D
MLSRSNPTQSPTVRKVRSGWPSMRVLLFALLGGGLMLPPAFAQDEGDDPPADDEPQTPRARPMPPGGRAGPGGPLGAGGGLPGTNNRGEGPNGPGDVRIGPDSDDDAEQEEEDVATKGPTESRQKPAVVDPNAKVTIDFVDTPLSDVIKYMAEITGRNFILADSVKGNVTIISHQPVTVAEAYEAFLSAMEMSGYTTVTVGKVTKVVTLGDASSAPLRVYEGGDVPYTDNFVTQIVQLNNVSVSDISSVVKELAGKSAKVIAYQPTNTLIITDAATNIRRVYRIISQLDVAAPRSRLEIIPLSHATAADIEKIITDLYGGSAKAAKPDASAETSSSRRSRRNRTTETEAAPTASATTAGVEGRYIEKIIADERTNSLVLMANEEAINTIKDLISRLDVDVDPSSRAQIHVIYLEHAKAEDVAGVLANLSESGNSKSSSSSQNRNQGRQQQGGPGQPPGRPGAEETSSESAVAAFDSGVRITSDENTNSLVIIATTDQFRIIQQVIERLDIRRKQVFVQAVIMELSTDNTIETGVGYHVGKPGEDGALSIFSGQFNGSSLGLSSDVLTGMAMGVFGTPVDVAVTGSDGTASTLSVPAFGIALNALQSDSAVNILGTPEILTLDNEEAKIVVGRNIPFPVSTGRDNNNNPIVSYQREDVATTLKVTPQINESNFVTLEVFQEVTEVEEDSQGLDVSTSGFITSKRSAETTVLVKDNQTVVIGGLIGATETEVETKVPVLGDLPLVGTLFRGSRTTSRKTNLLIFLTPHVIAEPADLEEVYRIKYAQRQEFIRRFYGKSRDEQEAEMKSLLSYSMNQVDEPSPWRTKSDSAMQVQTIGGNLDSTTPVMDMDPPPASSPATQPMNLTPPPSDPDDAAPVGDPD